MWLVQRKTHSRTKEGSGKKGRRMRILTGYSRIGQSFTGVIGFLSSAGHYYYKALGMEE